MDFLTRGGEYLSRFPDFLLVGRDAELQRLISILMRGRSNSAILLGSGGVGCSSICIGIQAAKSASDAPFDLVNKRLFWLDTNGLFSSGNGEQTSHAFSKIIGRLTKTPESILIIDDTRDFIEAARNGGSGHFINALLAALRERRTQIILEVKDDDLDLVLKSHSDIKELFTVLPIDEPVGDSLLSIVRTSASALSKHHGIKINGEAIRRAIELTNKYRSRDARSQPA
jgi:ATP-dependent Clp protease ATP-binding subunit ClpB